MPIKADDLTKLKATLKGFDVDKLIAAAIATDEQPFEVPADVQVLTTAELTTRDEQMKGQGKKEGEPIGETKGKEIVVKQIAKALALDATIVGNDITKLEAEATKKFKAGDAGLQQQVDLLLKDKETLTAEVTAAKENAASAIFDTQLIGMFPAGRINTLKDNEMLMLIKNELKFEMVDGKMVAKKGDVIMADGTTHAPLPLDKVLQNVFNERKWVAEGGGGDGGRGGGHNAGSGLTGVKKLSEFTEKWKAENPGKNDLSVEFDTALQLHTKDMKDFDMAG